MRVTYTTNIRINGRGYIRKLIFFQACERAESSKSCNLIGSESGQYFTILPANPGGIVGSFIHKFVGYLWTSKNRHFQTIFLLKLALLLASAREKWILFFGPPSRWITYIYYSFKIFHRFWLAKSTRLIHHNQLLMTKFGRILCLTRKWRQKCSVHAG